MQSFIQNPTIFSQPIRLAITEQQNPQVVLNCFFNAYNLASAKQHLADCVEIALTTDNMLYDAPLDRADLFHFYRLMEELMEAAYIINTSNLLLQERGDADTLDPKKDSFSLP